MYFECFANYHIENLYIKGHVLYYDQYDSAMIIRFHFLLLSDP